MRPYGTTFAFAPPLTVREADIDEIVSLLGDAIKAAAR